MPSAEYWINRHRAQGPHYVAKGGRASASRRQVEAVTPFLRWAVQGRRVLDFGCGPGRFRDVLSEGGREYVGVDLVPGLGTEPLGRALPRGFDTAAAIFVLQHIVSEAEYLHWTAELFECLNPGGRLVVVDHRRMRNPDPHMAPRGPLALQETAPWSKVNIWGDYDGHWLGWADR